MGLRGICAVVVVAALLVGCTGGTADGSPTATGTATHASGSPSPTPTTRGEVTPAEPSATASPTAAAAVATSTPTLVRATTTQPTPAATNTPPPSPTARAAAPSATSPPPSTATPTPAPPTATPTPAGIGQSPPDGDPNATLILAVGAPPQAVNGEVSHPLGDTVDRVFYVVQSPADASSARTLRVDVSCRFFGDRQFIVRVDGAAFSQHCGTTIEVPLQAQTEAGEVTGVIHLSAPGLGPTRVEWTLTLSVTPLANAPG